MLSVERSLILSKNIDVDVYLLFYFYAERKQTNLSSFCHLFFLSAAAINQPSQKHVSDIAFEAAQSNTRFPIKQTLQNFNALIVFL